MIPDGKRSPSFNMAADACLLEIAEAGESAPILRIYGWNEPAITIGYHQVFDRAVDTGKLGGMPVIRRVTGGRALLHDDGELTYALAGNFIRYPVLGKSLGDSYRIISQAIVLFYGMIGWEASISRRDNPIRSSGSRALQKGCFAAVSRYEIIVGGEKVAAGSQRRSRRALLQHGAIKITAPSSHPAVLQEPCAVKKAVIPVSLESREELLEALTRAFEKTLKIRLSPEPFSNSELSVIGRREICFKNMSLA